MRLCLATLHVRPSAQAVPLAAGCLAAALPERLRKQTNLVDLFPDQGEEVQLAAILQTDPAVVAFPLYSWNRTRALALGRRLRAHHPRVVLLCGGPEATGDPQRVLDEGDLDGVVLGEGEETFRKLLTTLEKGEPPRGIEGLLWRGDEPTTTGTQRPTPPLDKLPSPWLTGVLQPETGGGVLWEISRGCPFACDFCFDARGTSGVRHVPWERLEAELELFVQAGAAQIWVLDSTFNFPPERGLRLLRLLKDKAPHIHVHLEAKAEFLDRQSARFLAQIPCSVQLGLQSAHPEVLKHIHRPLNPKMFTERVHLLSREGVTFGLDLIYGLPGDDHAGFQRSLDFALNLGPNNLDLFPLAVLPGTPLFKKRKEYDLHCQEAPPYTIMHSASYSSADLAKSALLAGSANIFYNVGRAVGFFASLLKVTESSPSTFLEGFLQWMQAERGLSEQELLEEGRWDPPSALNLQEGYIRHILRERGKKPLIAATIDLMRFHFHHAETLLGEETLPAASMPPEDPWTTPWQRAPQTSLQTFRYEILDLLEMGEVDLEEFCARFRPTGSTALFFRRGGEVFSESLEEEFLQLLQQADGRRSPKEIFAGALAEREGREIVQFALAEGFLVPPPINHYL